MQRVRSPFLWKGCSATGELEFQPNPGRAAAISRTNGALLHSRVQTIVVELVLRTSGQDEEQAPGGSRSEVAPLPHP